MVDVLAAIDMIIEGKTYREISAHFNISIGGLHKSLSTSEHSARVREALEFSASSYADKAEQVLLDAKSNLVEIQRARELAQHYRWKASKRAPKKYGDKIDVEHSGEVKNVTTIKWGDKEIGV